MNFLEACVPPQHLRFDMNLWILMDFRHEISFNHFLCEIFDVGFILLLKTKGGAQALPSFGNLMSKEGENAFSLYHMQSNYQNEK